MSEGGTTFRLRINRRSAVPVHEQIVERVLRAIEAGQLAAGNMLPSTRSVACAEGINLMTVSRAYKALRARGVVELVPGIGIQVANGANALDEHERAQKLEGAMLRLIAAARELRVSAPALEREFARVLSRVIDAEDMSRGRE